MIPNQPLGRGDTGSEPGDTMTKTTGGDSQLWQLIRNTPGPAAAASAPPEPLEKEGARPGSTEQVPRHDQHLSPNHTLLEINLKKHTEI